MIKRIEPLDIFRNIPCSIVAVGTALNYRTPSQVASLKPYGLNSDGYLSLNNATRFFNQYLRIRKRVDYPKYNRPTLMQLMTGNKYKAMVCVVGHLVFVSGETYYSFFDNLNDRVVTVWWLGG